MMRRKELASSEADRESEERERGTSLGGRIEHK